MTTIPPDLLNRLKDGLSQVNVEYISHPEFTLDDYRGMAVQYLLSALLIALNESGDCGLYSHPETHGWTGWVTAGNCTLFFAPTKTVVLCGDERSRIEGDLSPVGRV